MFDITTIQHALQETGVHGWIFSNFSHRDTLTDSLLSLDSKGISSRRWVYIIEASGNATKLVHSIEPNILDSLPGNTLTYYGQQQLVNQLQKYSGKTFAILKDKNISVISTVDSGFVELLDSCNITTTSASPIIQITKGLLSTTQIESHERASSLLYKIVQQTWEFISNHYKTEIPLTEYSVFNYILQKFDDFSLAYDHEPIVAFGKNAGNPHYGVTKESSATAKVGDIIQLDIFAKEKFARNENGEISESNAAYADISWVGVFDTEPSENFNTTFAILIKARDTVYNVLKEHSQKNTIFTVTGSELDKEVRNVLIKAGFEKDIKHRTGHGIDTECHGSGVNLDSVEFPDTRTVKNGSCFSVEPGLYFENYGMRTEINIYIKDGEPIISGNCYKNSNTLENPQNSLLYIT